MPWDVPGNLVPGSRGRSRTVLRRLDAQTTPRARPQLNAQRRPVKVCARPRGTGLRDGPTRYRCRRGQGPNAGRSSRTPRRGEPQSRCAAATSPVCWPARPRPRARCGPAASRSSPPGIVGTSPPISWPNRSSTHRHRRRSDHRRRPSAAARPARRGRRQQATGDGRRYLAPPGTPWPPPGSAGSPQPARALRGRGPSRRRRGRPGRPPARRRGPGRHRSDTATQSDTGA
jgi:hypothetical protein